MRRVERLEEEKKAIAEDILDVANKAPIIKLLNMVLFQGLQAIASLYLPHINADIIDNGVAKADTIVIYSLQNIRQAQRVVAVPIGDYPINEQSNYQETRQSPAYQ